MLIIDRPGTVRRRLLQALTAALLLVLAPAFGQQAEQPQAPETPAPAVAKIRFAEIPARAEETVATLRTIQSRLAPEARVEQSRRELRQFADQLDQMAADVAEQSLPQLGIRALDDVELRWESANGSLRGIEAVLTERSQVLDRQLELLGELRRPWALTLDARQEDQLPDALVERVESLLAEIDRIEGLARARLDAVLTIQNAVSERLVTVGDTLSRIDQAKQAFRDQMLIRIDGPPLWELFAAGDRAPAEEVQQQLGRGWGQSVSTARSYFENYPDRLIAVVLCFLALSGLLLIVRARRRARHLRDGGAQEDVIDALSRPIAAALLLTVLMANSLLDNAPLALRDLVRLTAALPVFLIMRRVIPQEMRLPVYSVIALYVLDLGSDLVALGPAAKRWSDLLIAAAALGVLLWTLRPGGWASSHRGGRYWRMALLLLKAAALVLTAAIVANVVGAVTLSGLLTDATLRSAYAGLGWYAILLIVQGLMDAFLGSFLAARSRGLSDQTPAIKAYFERITNLLGALAWLTLTLRAFRLDEPVWDGLKTLFLGSVKIGNFEVSLSDVAAFIIAIWAGVLISRVLRFVLEQDVYPRVQLPRGVPSAISAMLHYAILTIAFLVALAVAGIEIGKFAIVAGALGVGIGFGLQNVVNNFVSGLILLFERPIQAGDAVELGPLFGRVVRIGIRSSTVRTYQGAEVIVPNADLISKEVINWTLSDSHRRLELPVGVAYSSDPRQVVEILLAAGRAHREVMAEPEPMVMFMGYGASSLDFELRCWVQSYLEGLRVKTDIYLDIWDRLKAAGIEIPFPQQDLHLRSVDADAAATLAGRRADEPAGAATGPADRGPDPERAPARGARVLPNDPEPLLDPDADGSPT